MKLPRAHPCLGIDVVNGGKLESDHLTPHASRVARETWVSSSATEQSGGRCVRVTYSAVTQLRRGFGLSGIPPDATRNVVVIVF